ncbi:hypothetical protein [Acidovorax sp. Root275]|uniref:hypothetical protein n=1 Tax=Acidovorax sp. Root275 TaxID=1736508 RepID=UPI000A78D521|nr:hypothetical protein [Acidovorax sp. Root275]
MKWLKRLKAASKARTYATKPTEPGFVGFVACSDGASENFKAPRHPPANEATADPDRWCWPHGPAMNTAEIDIFTARLARFTDKRLTLDDAEALADRLVTRDREMDDRRICMECVHLQGAGRWRCSNTVMAGIGAHMADTLLPGSLTHQLQRCAGFINFYSQGNTP